MKIILSIVAMIMWVPIAAFSMEAVSDSEMEAVSGAGVNIHFTGAATVTTAITNLSYTDDAAVTLTGTITNTIAIADGADLTVDVTGSVSDGLTTTGIAIGGLSDVTVGMTLPSSLGVSIKGESIGSVGGNFSVTIAAPTSLIISAH